MIERLRSNYVEVLQQETEVAQLDPLNLDLFFKAKFVDANTRKDTVLLSQQATQSSEVTLNAEGLTVNQARACMRDLGFLGAALVTHGIGLEETPGLKEALNKLSGITQEVPRDTVYSYSLRNPEGERMRTFTGTDEERLFIMATKRGVVSTTEVAYVLQDLAMEASESVSTSRRINQCAQAFEGMVNAMAEVRRAISPEFFTNILRPYFPPMEIDGVTYFGPGGAQMPLVLIDLALWGSDIQERNYLLYLQDNLRYLPPELRQLALDINGQSLVTRVENGQLSTEFAKELYSLTNLLLRFRNPHYKTAVENMQVRPEGAKGSGGYDTQVLDLLMAKTYESKERLSAVLDRS